MSSAASSLLAARVDPNQTSNMSSTPALLEAALKVLSVLKLAEKLNLNNSISTKKREMWKLFKCWHHIRTSNWMQLITFTPASQHFIKLL